MKYMILKKIALGMLLNGYFFNVVYAKTSDFSVTSNYIVGHAPLVNAPSVLAANSNTPKFNFNSVDITSDRKDNKALQIGDILTLKFSVVDEDNDLDSGAKQTLATVRFGYIDNKTKNFVWTNKQVRLKKDGALSSSSGIAEWVIPSEAEGSLLAYRIQPTTQYGNPRKSEKAIVGYVHVSGSSGFAEESSSSAPDKSNGTGGGLAIKNNNVVESIEKGATITIHNAENIAGEIKVGSPLANGIPKVQNYYTVKVLSSSKIDITEKFAYKWSLVEQDFRVINGNTKEANVTDLVTATNKINDYSNDIEGIVFQIPINSELKTNADPNNSQSRYAGAQGYHLEVKADYVGVKLQISEQKDDTPDLIKRLLSD